MAVKICDCDSRTFSLKHWIHPCSAMPRPKKVESNLSCRWSTL